MPAVASPGPIPLRLRHGRAAFPPRSAPLPLGIGQQLVPHIPYFLFVASSPVPPSLKRTPPPSLPPSHLWRKLISSINSRDHHRVASPPLSSLSSSLSCAPHSSTSSGEIYANPRRIPDHPTRQSLSLCPSVPEERKAATDTAAIAAVSGGTELFIISA